MVEPIKPHIFWHKGPRCALQVLGLQAVGVPALALTSLTSKDDLNTAYKRLDSPDVRLVYGEREHHCLKAEGQATLQSASLKHDSCCCAMNSLLCAMPCSHPRACGVRQALHVKTGKAAQGTE